MNPNSPLVNLFQKTGSVPLAIHPARMMMGNALNDYQRMGIPQGNHDYLSQSYWSSPFIGPQDSNEQGFYNLFHHFVGGHAMPDGHRPGTPDNWQSMPMIYGTPRSLKATVSPRLI